MPEILSHKMTSFLRHACANQKRRTFPDLQIPLLSFYLAYKNVTALEFIKSEKNKELAEVLISIREKLNRVRIF